MRKDRWLISNFSFLETFIWNIVKFSRNFWCEFWNVLKFCIKIVFWKSLIIILLLPILYSFMRKFKAILKVLEWKKHQQLVTFVSESTMLHIGLWRLPLNTQKIWFQSQQQSNEYCQRCMNKLCVVNRYVSLLKVYRTGYHI